jgi:hypothetical protein
MRNEDIILVLGRTNNSSWNEIASVHLVNPEQGTRELISNDSQLKSIGNSVRQQNTTEAEHSSICLPWVAIRSGRRRQQERESIIIYIGLMHEHAKKNMGRRDRNTTARNRISTQVDKEIMTRTSSQRQWPARRKKAKKVQQ